MSLLSLLCNCLVFLVLVAGLQSCQQERLSFCKSGLHALNSSSGWCKSAIVCWARGSGLTKLPSALPRYSQAGTMGRKSLTMLHCASFVVVYVVVKVVLKVVCVRSRLAFVSTHRHTHTQRDTDIDTDTDRHRHKHRHRQTHTQTPTPTDTDTDTEIDTSTKTDTNRHRH